MLSGPPLPSNLERRGTAQERKQLLDFGVFERRMARDIEDFCVRGNGDGQWKTYSRLVWNSTVGFCEINIEHGCVGENWKRVQQWLSCETRVTSNNFQALVIKVLMHHGEFMRLKFTTMVFWRQLFEGQREALKTETQMCTVACSPRKKKLCVEDRAIPVIRVVSAPYSCDLALQVRT